MCHRGCLLCSREKLLPNDLFSEVGRDLCHCTHEAQTLNVYIYLDRAWKSHSLTEKYLDFMLCNPETRGLQLYEEFAELIPR